MIFGGWMMKQYLWMMVAMITCAVGYADSVTALRKPCRELASRREATREAAIVSLIKAGDLGAKALGAYMDKQSTAYRVDALEVLVQIPGEEMGRVLADRAVRERNDKVQQKAIALLDKHGSDSSRAMLVTLVQDPSSGVRRSAGSVIAALKDPTYVDTLIAQFAAQLKAQSAGGVGVNASVSRLEGFDNYDQKYRISTPNGPKTITQKMRMPIISGVSISTYAGLPAGLGLVEVTGQNFGTDIEKWQGWWQKNRKRNRR